MLRSESGVQSYFSGSGTAVEDGEERMREECCREKGLPSASFWARHSQYRGGYTESVAPVRSQAQIREALHTPLPLPVDILVTDGFWERDSNYLLLYTKFQIHGHTDGLS